MNCPKESVVGAVRIVVESKIARPYWVLVLVLKAEHIAIHGASPLASLPARERKTLQIERFLARAGDLWIHAVIADERVITLLIERHANISGKRRVGRFPRSVFARGGD